MFQTPPLRTLLRANAVFASTTGLTALVATGSVAGLIGVEHHRLVSATGAGLLMFAVGLVIESGAPATHLVVAGRLISLADGLWVAATAVILVVGDLTIEGNVILTVIAAIVGGFAVLQVRAVGQLEGRGANQVVQVTKVLDAPIDDVWAVVIDHEAYGRLAPNLSRVIPTGPDGPDLTRRCWDTRGRQWDEACVLWEDGHRFAVEVDTSADDYPYPLAYLRGEWAVRAVGGDRTEVTIRFELRPQPGPVGSAFAMAMTTGAKPMLHRIMNGWQDMASGQRAR